MPTQRRSRSDRQPQIAEAALQLALSQGLAALNTRSLAAALGLSSGALFRHFGGMQEVLGAVLDAVAKRLDATYPQDPDPLQALTRFVVARSQAVGGKQPLLRLLLSDELARALRPADRRRLGAMIQATRRWVEGQILRGQKAGAFRKDLGAGDLALLVMGLVQMRALGMAGGRFSPDAVLIALLRR